MPAFEATDPRHAAKDPRYVAAIKLIERQGAKEFQIRYDEEQDPIVWVATAGFAIHNGKIGRSGKVNAHQCGAGLNPLTAIFSLCHNSLDRRGLCLHCHRNTMFDENFEINPDTLTDAYCFYQWDPENSTFRRGCEGDT